MLEDAEYNLHTTNVDIAYAESLLEILKKEKEWHDGNIVFVPHFFSNNSTLLYTIWERKGAKDFRKQLEKPIMIARDRIELGGAVKAYHSMGRTSLAVPKRNYSPQLSSSDIVYELYLV
ncbi:hypothetical protein HZB88_03445, partial [archaeon]|nr:hypothetical protein [archaeon]